MKTTNLPCAKPLFTLTIAAGLSYCSCVAFAADPPTPSPSPVAPAPAQPSPPKAEPQSEPSKAAEPQVQAQADKQATEKRAQLLKDAQSAIDESRKALEALDHDKKDDALAALANATGKLDLIVARDPKLALAPVGVATVVRDLYANPDTVKAAIKEASSDLSRGKVQEARTLLAGLASESELQVSNIPLATYPVAIKAIAPLIDAGKKDEAKSALQLALNTLVVQRFITPLPTTRAMVMLGDAEKLAGKTGRSSEENKHLRELVEAARHQLEIGEILGYGARDDYQPMYAMLDDIETKTSGGKSGPGIFDKINEALKKFPERLFK